MTDSPQNPAPALSGFGAAFLDSLYDEFKINPSAVGGEWSDYFDQLTPAQRQKLESEMAARTAAAEEDEIVGFASEAPNGSAHAAPPAPVVHKTEQSIINEQSTKTEPATNTGGPAKANTTTSAGRREPLKGVAAKIVENMEASLQIPTATTFRNIPVKALEENRKLLNQVLEPRGKSKITFTHLIGYALVRSLVKHPALNVNYELSGGAPHRHIPEFVNFGLAIDLPRPDGGRSLVVPNIKKADTLTFVEFTAAVDDVIARGRAGKLTPADFQGTTVTLTNPGTLGTIASVPRLMKGQGAIIATGAIDYSAEAQAMSEEARVAFGISKMMGITSTYDHRVIQGAESGAYLAFVHELLEGGHDFYKKIFVELRVPFAPFRHEPDTKKPASSLDATKNALERSAKMQQLVDAYRRQGHRLADLDPLQLSSPAGHAELELQHYGFTLWDLDREFYVGLGSPEKVDELLRNNFIIYNPQSFATLRHAIARLQKIYSQRIGYEVEHLASAEQRAWLREHVETFPIENISKDGKLRILRRLIEADTFERFIHTRYVGQKRFSLEGGDALIPLLAILFRSAHGAKVTEAVIGMAHRGRLNVLAQLVGMPLERIFAEFEGVAGASGGYSGDVKYHLGFDGAFIIDENSKFPVSLACNPSHLEAVNPVVEGIARAKQDLRGDAERTSVLPVLIHGDAAFAGQGVVMETLQFAQLDGFKTGGTVHIIVNNQIGYTANPRDSRSSLYCSDLAKTIEAPVFHVNGDDALSVAHVTKLAFEYRKKFKHDVVIDLVCYRRHGHNEGDEPGFTQPVMYHTIEHHPAPRVHFERELLRSKLIDENYAKQYEAEFTEKLSAARDAVRNKQWTPKRETIQIEPSEPTTGVDRELLVNLGTAASLWPDTFVPHPKIERLFKKRRQALDATEPAVDFGLAETLAFATLLAQGVDVRLSGEDSGRGTFSHRHSVLHHYQNANRYIPLNHLGGPGLRRDGQANYEVTDTLLSEEAVLGFEYGYSVERHRGHATKRALVLWEAQFGDFVNGAQIQIDQFIAAGEAKWGQACGLVLLLPHGHDGQGPEHSSARLERFLQLCARDNMRVVNATTAAQYYHLLRDQALRRPARPLIVMTPKSLLRAAEAGSTMESLTTGRFEPLLDDSNTKINNSPAACRRVLLCSGKIYYDLAAEREKLQLSDVAILRLEQLYPLPEALLATQLSARPRAEIIWVQEEPENMGAGFFIKPRVTAVAGREISVISRPENPSPARGYALQHAEEQREIIAKAFAGLL